MNDENNCAIYMFPTKALAQDQLRALKELTRAMNIELSMCVFDGDTPQNQRQYLRENSRLLITNPDMLHVGMLPCHKLFARFFHNLRYIVLDEAHSYRGNFGSNTAMVIRRLRRICTFEHQNISGPQFIVSSATIANPREHVQQLTGVRDVRKTFGQLALFGIDG
jgi:DEAD/DEAH box helicase domain-containing protein